MKISSLQLQAFFQLSQDLNFTEAASNVHISQSALSTRIIKLEEELQTKLFIREKANVRLTDQGKRLLRYCASLRSMEEELLHDIGADGQKGGLNGLVRIGGFSSVMRSAVIPSLAKLLRENNGLKFEMLTGELSELPNLLKSSKVDFIIYNKALAGQQYQSQLLGTEANVLVESKKYPFNGYYLDHDSKDVTTSSYFKLRPELLEKSTRFRYMDDVYGLIDGVKNGLGRAVLPRHLVEGMSDLKILYPRTQLKVSLYLISYQNDYETQLERSTKQALCDYFTKCF